MSDPAASFINAVQGTMSKHQCSWADAWHRTRALQPVLYQRLMTMKSPRIVEMANEIASGERRLEAKNRLIAMVHRRMDRTGETFNEAWNTAVSGRHEFANGELSHLPEIQQLLSEFRQSESGTGGGSRKVTESPGASPKATSSRPPVWGPQNLAMLELPANTPPPIADEAFKANGNSVQLSRPKEVWAAVVAMFCGGPSGNRAAAEDLCRERFPNLYRRVTLS